SRPGVRSDVRAGSRPARRSDRYHRRRPEPRAAVHAGGSRRAMTIVGARGLFAKARRQIDGPHEALLIARMVSGDWVFRVLKHSVPLPRLVRLARWRVRVRSVSADQFEQIVTLARWASRPLRRSNRG